MWDADAEAAVAFYEQAFGLTRRVLLDNGPMGLYAELGTGPTTWRLIHGDLCGEGWARCSGRSLRGGMAEEHARSSES